MPEEGTIIEFKNVRAQQRLPFIIYADFECLTGDTGDAATPNNAAASKILDGVMHDHGTYCIKPKRHIRAYQQHVPISVGLKLVIEPSIPVGTVPAPAYETYTGQDVCEWFLRKLLHYEAMCLAYLFDEKRLIMTPADILAYATALECYICHEPFPTKPPEGRAAAISKVRDHDHITGAFRGAAHSGCNLKLRRSYKIPIIFHNFRGYDSHLIVRALGLFKDIPLNVIGQGLEKYLTVMWGDHLVFKDSLQFLSCSLERLVACLLRDGAEKFAQLSATCRGDGYTDAQIGLLLRKGVYPYDYMNTSARLTETQLPPIEEFASRLRQEECEPVDYAHAQVVWESFGCKSMLDYHNLYLKCDVLLLADVFESFRSISLTNYELDPAHFVSSPHLSWEAMLKMTKCRQELISDPAMFEMLHGSLRGGISTISKRYAKANNKYMGALYNPTVPSSYIIYLDANNLYGWAMSESLPTGDFRWLAADEWLTIDWCAQQVDQEFGYFIECDLLYPAELHDKHNDYPLAPERMRVEEPMLSDAQRDLRSKYEMSHLHTTKLIPNFMDKLKYVCHYRNLRFYLEHGLVLRTVHRVIRFRQSRWLQAYIGKNSTLRANSKDAFQKDFLKTMNNSVYGKTCENLTKRTDIRLVTDGRKCSKLIKKPHCLSFEIFNEDIAAIELQKVKCLINKPTYVGFTVLELSKLLMYKFHYDYTLKRYPNNEAQLLLTDTDSLIYHIHTDDVYADMFADSQHFDFSSYPTNNPFFNAANKMVIGKMKDEASGNIITEFVGLRPKMYSYRTLTSVDPPTFKDAKRAKGIQRVAAERLHHDSYVEQLHNPAENYVCVRRIGQKHHLMYTLEGDKRALCAFDDKRFLLPDNISTLAHGHYKLVDRIEDVEEPPPQLHQNEAVSSSHQTPNETAGAITLFDDDNHEQIMVLSHRTATTMFPPPKRRALTARMQSDLVDNSLWCQDPRDAFRRTSRTSNLGGWDTVCQFQSALLSMNHCDD